MNFEKVTGELLYICLHSIPTTLFKLPVNFELMLVFLNFLKAFQLQLFFIYTQKCCNYISLLSFRYFLKRKVL